MADNGDGKPGGGGPWGWRTLGMAGRHPEMLDIIVCETNREAKRSHSDWNDANPDNQRVWQETSVAETEAFIGLLILAGLHRGRLEPLEDLWSLRSGRPVFSALMSLKQFKALMKYLRFDNKATREERRANDKLATFCDVWEMFVAQLPKFYLPGTDLTVDEQLVAFRGRCPFQQYMPNKPAKYGVKIWWACDAETSYPLAGEVYLGRQLGTERDVNQGARVVKALTEKWLQSGRNIVSDNFFTSIPLAEDLFAQNMTLVGTIRKNKSNVPAKTTTAQRREERSSIFGFCDNLTLVSYVPKKGKVATAFFNASRHPC